MTDKKQDFKNLGERLAWVMRQVGWIQKSGHNRSQNYDYATDADVSDVVREKLAEVDVAVIPYVQSLAFREIQGKEKPIPVATVIMDLTFVYGEERLTVRTVGEGMDSGDKNVYKAMTGAVKYALLKAFLLPTGDDPEKDNKDEESEDPTTAEPVKTEPTLVKPQASEAPACPKCGAPMVIKEAKKGKNAGNKFWGCSKWGDTKCSGALPYRKEVKEPPKKEKPKDNQARLSALLTELSLAFEPGELDKWIVLNFGQELKTMSDNAMQALENAIRNRVKSVNAEVFSRDVRAVANEDLPF